VWELSFPGDHSGGEAVWMGRSIDGVNWTWSGGRKS